MKALRIFRRISLVLFIVLACFLFARTNVVKAAGAPTGSGFSGSLTVVGAQVRTTGKAGLRFVGKATDVVPSQASVTIKAYGIAVGFGIDRTNYLSADGSFNSKNVLNAEVTEIDENGFYYVTIFNIPETAYMQYFTARAYVRYDDNSVDYGDNRVERSLGQVCYSYRNDPEIKDAEIIKNVTRYIENNNKKNIWLCQNTIDYYFDNFNDAFKMADNGDVICVYEMHELPSNYNTITVEKNITLAFDGHSEIVVPADVTLFNVANGGTLTIKSGNFNGNGSISEFNKTILTNNPLAITSDDDTYRNNKNLFTVNGASKLYFEDTQFKNFICLSNDYSKSSSIVKAVGKSASEKCEIKFTNSAVTNCIGMTGTVLLGSYTRLYLTNSTINANFSVRNANHGMFYLTDSSKGYFSGNTITNNVYNGNGGFIGLINGTELTLGADDVFENNIGGGYTGELFGELVSNGRFGLIYIHTTSMINVNGSFSNNEIHTHKVSDFRYSDLKDVTSQDVVAKVTANGGNIRITGLIDVHGNAYHTTEQCAVTFKGGTFTNNYYIYADGVKYKTAISIDNDIVNMGSFAYDDLTNNHWIDKEVNVGAYVGSLITFPDLANDYKVVPHE